MSSFPIHLGEPVRFMALAQNPENEGRFISSADGIWQPITLPVKAIYNEYGSITKLDEGPVTDAFFQVLNTRAVERGVGDNSVHDVPVWQGMTRREWFTALWEGRVQIADAHSATRLQVVQTMIREDVWQVLVTECQHPQKALEDLVRSPGMARPLANLRLRPDDGLIIAMTELLRAQTTLANIGRHWAQGTTIGPLGADGWPTHERFSKALLAISNSQCAGLSAD